MKQAWVPALALLASAGGVSAAQQAVSIGLVLDTSGSMGPKMGLVRQALSKLIEDASPGDEIALIEASDQPLVLSGFGSDADTLLAYVSPSEARGGSALVEAIYLGAQLVKTGRNDRKALLLISDGGDDGSRYKWAEIAPSVRETGARIFVIALSEPSPQKTADTALLAQIASQSGGRQFDLQSASELPRIAAELHSAMRTSAP